MRTLKTGRAAGPLVVCCALFAALLNLALSGESWRPLTLTLCIVLAVGLVLLSKRLRPGPAVIALGAYVLICALSGLFALSGKFFFKEYAKLVVAFGVFLAVAAAGKDATSKIALVLAVMAGIFSTVSIELASTGYLMGLYRAITGYYGLDVGFESGVRLLGVFSNPNVLASLLALGFFLCMYMLRAGQGRSGPLAALASCCAYGFLMAFSLGGTVFFALASLLYLALSGKSRGLVLARYGLIWLPTAVLVFIAFPFFEATGFLAWLPMLFMVLNGAAAWALESLVYPRLCPLLENRGNVACLSFLALVLVLGFLAMNATGSYHYHQRGILSRSVYLEPGQHTLSVVADGYIGLTVYSQTDGEIMTQTRTTVAKQWLLTGSQAVLDIPQGSQVQQLVLWGSAGRDLSSVTIDGERVKLDYKLLPDFIVNRLQGFWKNQNAVQRTVFFSDGLKLFSKHKLLGGGMGAFESAACSVQSYYYETRYVHNHYIQILTDSGLLGLGSYLAFLILLILALIRGRREWGSLGPVLAACLLMIGGHSVMEVNLSMWAYLPTAFAIFGLICANYDRPLGIKAGAARIMSLGAGSLYLIFALLICLNLWAASLISSAGDYNSFMAALERAGETDPFEYNDYRISYVYNSLSSGDEYRQRAEEYAAGLSDVQSNSITDTLVEYYLTTKSYDKALDCARFGAMNNRSNPDTWNSYFNMLAQALPPDSLSQEQAREVAGLYQILQSANEQLMYPVELTEENIQYVLAAQQLAG